MGRLAFSPPSVGEEASSRQSVRVNFSSSPLQVNVIQCKSKHNGGGKSPCSAWAEIIAFETHICTYPGMKRTKRSLSISLRRTIFYAKNGERNRSCHVSWRVFKGAEIQTPALSYFSPGDWSSFCVWRQCVCVYFGEGGGGGNYRVLAGLKRVFCPSPGEKETKTTSATCYLNLSPTSRQERKEGRMRRHQFKFLLIWGKSRDALVGFSRPFSRKILPPPPRLHF